MPPIDFKKVVIVILVVILLARMPDVLRWIALFRLGDMMKDLADSIWRGPQLLRHILILEVMVLFFVIAVKFFQRK
jgi:hypothetical protein